ncbi:MAG TPA: hypothetical protein VI935_07290 [Thermodesulfobacteriota bacterium]|nr:hypothetical protein [Thermodesulfobacteriota bacterium]
MSKKPIFAGIALDTTGEKQYLGCIKITIIPLPHTYDFNSTTSTLRGRCQGVSYHVCKQIASGYFYLM